MIVPLPDLDLYDIAFLAGGADRVVDTALVALVESGRIRVHAPGELAVVDPGRQHPVEAAVMDAVGTLGHRSTDTVRWRLADDARLGDVGRSLAAAGLLKRRPGLGRRSPNNPGWSTTAAGREAIRRATERPPAAPTLDGGSALEVALHGREHMPDTGLRASIFEHPLPALEPRARGADERRRRQEVLDGDPTAAAYAARNAIGLGGAIGFGGDGGGGS